MADVKESLPVEYVLHRAGIPVNDDGSALCPFHDDHEPSLDTYPPNRWLCSPCGRGGDVLDLLARFAPALTFPQRMKWAERLLREMGNGWQVNTVPKPPFDAGTGSALVAEAYKNFNAPAEFAMLKGYPFGGSFLRDWGVGGYGDKIVIPYWSKTGELRTYRTRLISGQDKPRSAPGLAEPTFYGEWRLSIHSKVVICEGESDTWSAAWAVGDRMDVLGVPGAGRPPYNLHLLSGRKVILAFDGDVAGRAASLRWAEAIGDAASRIHLPEGRDLASYTTSELQAMLL